jgi:hypothetical protein
MSRTMQVAPRQHRPGQLETKRLTQPALTPRGGVLQAVLSSNKRSLNVVHGLHGANGTCTRVCMGWMGCTYVHEYALQGFPTPDFMQDVILSPLRGGLSRTVSSVRYEFGAGAMLRIRSWSPQARESGTFTNNASKILYFFCG